MVAPGVADRVGRSHHGGVPAERAPQPARPSPPARPPVGKPRLDEIFGPDPDVDVHRSHGDDEAREDWYRQNRPPHHES